MNRRQFQQCSEQARQRAVAFGEAGDPQAVGELLDLYIEYWGLDTTDYKIGMLHKQKLYQQQGKRLLSLYPADLPYLDAKLRVALGLRLPPDETSAASRVAPHDADRLPTR